MPADLGWAMGGYTALVTKSGTNHIHGDVFEYFRNTGLTADNQFTQATELAPKTGSPLRPQTTPHSLVRFKTQVTTN
jgi:hypothetical protein